MKILINYADLTYFESRRQNSESGKSVGGFDRVIEYDRNDIDPQFLKDNANILNQKNKGVGYWLWKPHIILKTVQQASDDDIIFYCDAGCNFIGSMTPYFEVCEQEKNGLILFSSNQMNDTWTKRDCFHYMGMDSLAYTKTEHLCASFFLCKKTDFVVKFLSEWIEYMEDPRISTDLPNTCGLDNYPLFRDHRWDQSVLSLLARHYNVSLLKDLTQFGNEFDDPRYRKETQAMKDSRTHRTPLSGGVIQYIDGAIIKRDEDDLPQVIHHHRTRR